MILRKKSREPSVIVTFHTTAEAMETERTCQKRGVPGRLVSAPRELTSDCGIAWVSPAGAEDALRAAILEAGIAVDAFYRMEY